MKFLLLPLFALTLVCVRAADTNELTALRAADDERVSATIAADRARLDAIFCDDMRYAHSSGKVDSKASYIQSVVSGSTKYFSIDYDERQFKVVTPDIGLMTGRAAFKSANDGQPVDLYLGFLAVWKKTNGKWQFLAWQSCRLTPPNAASGTKK